jgi:hypothetical protein
MYVHRRQLVRRRQLSWVPPWRSQENFCRRQIRFKKTHPWGLFLTTWVWFAEIRRQHLWGENKRTRKDPVLNNMSLNPGGEVCPRGRTWHTGVYCENVHPFVHSDEGRTLSNI